MEIDAKFLPRLHRRWETQQESAAADARELFRQCILLTIEIAATVAKWLEDQATSLCVIKISGSGGPSALAWSGNLLAPFYIRLAQGRGENRWDWNDR